VSLTSTLCPYTTLFRSYDRIEHVAPPRKRVKQVFAYFFCRRVDFLGEIPACFAGRRENALPYIPRVLTGLDDVPGADNVVGHRQLGSAHVRTPVTRKFR